MSHAVSIAPMIGLTNRHFRYLLRQITHHAWVYTEMYTANSLIYGNATHKLLEFNELEHPIACQLGGNSPNMLAQATIKVCEYNYDEVNLNVGCPSDKVQAGNFGACLMKEPQLVASCIKAMQDVASIPITVKTRIGIDDLDSYQFLHDFIATVNEVGACKHFIIHARKAWLHGLSPKQNRTIPELKYDLVHKIKDDFPELKIILNGGIKDLQVAIEHNVKLDGVMIGREAYYNPYQLIDVDHMFYQAVQEKPTRVEIIENLIPYIEQQLAEKIPLWNVSRHLLGLAQGVPGARNWRKFLTENSNSKSATIDVIIKAQEMLFQMENGDI